MAQNRRERRRYDAISSNEEIEEDRVTDGTTSPGAARETRTRNNQSSPRGTSTHRQPYNRISSDDDDDDDDEKQSILDDNSTIDVNDDNDVESSDLTADATMTLVVLDVAQQRFSVPASPTWSIAHFKKVGASIHKVAASRQRLIFRGKMLQDTDNKTLEDYGITQDGTILHLFPKPRVVVTNGSDMSSPTSQSDASGENDGEDHDEETGGARVPTIVMDAQEAERRSQILVLGSTDYIEAQNNVKLFSFMLLIISSIELLNLFGILMGVPQEDADHSSGMVVHQDDFHFSTDDFFANSSYVNPNDSSTPTDDPVEEYLSHWGTAQWIDSAVSILGVYVALIGLKASTENTLRLARTYFLFLVVVGVGWLLYNFFQTVEIEHKYEEKKHQQQDNSRGDTDDPIDELSESEMYDQAVQVMVLPFMVWLMCWMRAWQFQRLLFDAEQEAQERIQSQVESIVDHDEELALDRNAVPA